MLKSFCSGLTLLLCLSVLSLPAVSVLDGVERVSTAKPTTDFVSFAQDYFEKFKATQLPGATEEALNEYLALLHDDVGHTHLPWVPDDSRAPGGKQAMFDGMKFYLSAHTMYEAELLNVFTFSDVAIAIRYRQKAAGIHPQNKQTITYDAIVMEILEMEAGKVAIIRKYDESL